MLNNNKIKNASKTTETKRRGSLGARPNFHQEVLLSNNNSHHKALSKSVDRQTMSTYLNAAYSSHHNHQLYR